MVEAEEGSGGGCAVAGEKTRGEAFGLFLVAVVFWAFSRGLHPERRKPGF